VEGELQTTGLSIAQALEAASKAGKQKPAAKKSK
jgi:hypothetical protein